MEGFVTLLIRNKEFLRRAPRNKFIRVLHSNKKRIETPRMKWNRHTDPGGNFKRVQLSVHAWFTFYQSSAEISFVSHGWYLDIHFAAYTVGVQNAVAHVSNCIVGRGGFIHLLEGRTFAADCTPTPSSQGNDYIWLLSPFSVPIKKIQQPRGGCQVMAVSSLHPDTLSDLSLPTEYMTAPAFVCLSWPSRHDRNT